MELSNIAIGQMFIHCPEPIFENQERPMPRVWVKVTSEILFDQEVSLFVDNNALVQLSINRNYKFGIRDKWNITDAYYGRMVREGKFIPITDLRQTDGICLEMGWEPYKVDLGI